MQAIGTGIGTIIVVVIFGFVFMKTFDSRNDLVQHLITAIIITCIIVAPLFLAFVFLTNHWFISSVVIGAIAFFATGRQETGLGAGLLAMVVLFVGGYTLPYQYNESAKQQLIEEQQRRQEKLQRQQEELRRQQEEQRRRDEEERRREDELAEQRRKQEEQQRQEELRRQQEEQRRQEELRHQQEERKTSVGSDKISATDIFVGNSPFTGWDCYVMSETIKRSSQTNLISVRLKMITQTGEVKYLDYEFGSDGTFKNNDFSSKADADKTPIEWNIWQVITQTL